MKDNISAFSAEEYDTKIKNTVPYYEEFYKQVIDVVRCRFGRPVAWLDIGCGTGKMAEAAGVLPVRRLVLCDSSPDMLSIAKSRCDSINAEFVLSRAQELKYHNEFDVVTAVQVFHYLSAEEREIAVRKSYNALNKGGIFITFENFAPYTEVGKRFYLERWRRYQIKQGKKESECEQHICRYGTEYFPITADKYLRTMKECGFSAAEPLWLSYMQAGFLGIKQE